MHRNLEHLASRDVWVAFRQLRPDVLDAARASFALVKFDPNHPSLRFKKVDFHWSVWVKRGYHALTQRKDD